MYRELLLRAAPAAMAICALATMPAAAFPAQVDQPSASASSEAAAQSRRITRLLSLGGFAQRADPRMRAVLSPGGGETVSLNLYSPGKGHVHAVLSPSADGRELVGDSRDPSGALLARLRVQLVEEARAVRVVWDFWNLSGKPEDFIPQADFYAEWLGMNHNGEQYAGRWRTDLGELEVQRGGMSTAAYLVPSSAGRPAVSRRLATEDGHRDAAGVLTLSGLWDSADGGGAFAMRVAADGRSFDGEMLVDGVRRAWTGTRDPQPGPPPDPARDPAPGPPSAPAPSPPPVPAPSSAFQALRRYEVRLDRVVAARDAARTDVFLTLRNGGQAPLYVTSGALMVRLEDSDGVAKMNGQVLRPTPEGRVHFASTPVLDPGGELRVKYSFHPDAGATPGRVRVTEADKSLDFDL